MKNQKGITLIALIITIIVMLILVGVTVTLAINGGLFKEAKYAQTRTEEEKELEELQAITVGALNEKGEIDFTKLEGDLEGKFTYDAVENKWRSNKTGKLYTIDKRGIIDLASGTGNGDGQGTGGNGSGNENEIGGGNGSGNGSGDDSTTIVWQQNRTTTEDGKIVTATVTDGTRTLTVGTVVTNYTQQYNNGETVKSEWKILGAENGKLLLTTSTVVGVNDDYTLEFSAEDWDNTNHKWTALEDELNNLFEVDSNNGYYINKGTQAELIRSINVEDINRITGYDPTTDSAYKDIYGTPYTITGTLPNGTEGTMEIDYTYYDYEVAKYLENGTENPVYNFIYCNGWYSYMLASSCSLFGAANNSINNITVRVARR